VASRFRLDALHLRTSGGEVRYEFRGPLTVLAGEVGTGKSTLLEAVKYALGGRGLLTPIMQESVGNVSVEVTAGDSRFRLSRGVGRTQASEVAVTDLITREPVGLFPVVAPLGRSAETLSHFLLEALGIPVLSVASGRRRSQGAGRASSLTFNDVWSFVYVDQLEIDRSIAHNRDTVREPKRRAVFELLFGLVDEEQFDLEVQLSNANRMLADAVREVATVRQFLEDTRSSDRRAVEQEHREAAATRDGAEGRLAAIEADADPGDPYVVALQDMTVVAQRRLDELTEEIRTLAVAQQERRRALDGLRLDRRRLVRLWVADARLAAIEFQTCPRCMQQLSGRPVPTGACRLCLQPVEGELTAAAETALSGEGSLFPDAQMERQSVADAARDAEAVDITVQETELESLLAAGEQELAILQQQLAQTQAHLDYLRQTTDERTAVFATPRLAAVRQASADLASARERLLATERTLRQWDRVADLEAVAAAAARTRDELKEQVDEAVRRSEERRQIVATMSSDYQDTVHRLGVPGVTEAHLDPKSYLPVVGGTPFDRVSNGGGIRTALIVAYWVTLLATALREPTTLFPSILILDTPRKAMGAGEDLASRLYRQLATLTEAYEARGVQIIVADNELPSVYRKRWQELHFDYDEPAIPTVEHPGPGEVPTVESLAAVAGEVDLTAMEE
jgi:hypothetical protein